MNVPTELIVGTLIISVRNIGIVAGFGLLSHHFVYKQCIRDQCSLTFLYRSLIATINQMELYTKVNLGL